MFYCILLTVLTGLCWTSYGIILSFTARTKMDVILFGLVQNFCCMLLGIIFLAKWDHFNPAETLNLIPFVLAAGGLNAIGQFATKCAMSRGHNGLAWAISQSAMIIPFTAGVLFFNQQSTISQWLGVFLILAGIIMPNLTRTRNSLSWLILSLTAFLLFGTVQLLYLIPSLRNITDTANLRPVLASAGMIIGWGAIAAASRHRFEFQKKTVIIGGAMSLISISSLLLFFVSLDKLSKLALGNIAVPIMIGSNIFAFTLFSIFTIREKNTWKEWSSTIAVLLGIICLAI